MSLPVVSKIVFAVTYPSRQERGTNHIPPLKLRSLFRGQMTDLEVIECIDHLFKCSRCMDNYRRVRNALTPPEPPRLSGPRMKRAS